MRRINKLTIDKKDCANVVHNLNEIPLTFEDNSCNYIIYKEVLDHVNHVILIRELQRLINKVKLVNPR